MPFTGWTPGPGRRLGARAVRCPSGRSTSSGMVSEVLLGRWVRIMFFGHGRSFNSNRGS